MEQSKVQEDNSKRQRLWNDRDQLSQKRAEIRSKISKLEDEMTRHSQERYRLIEHIKAVFADKKLLIDDQILTNLAQLETYISHFNQETENLKTRKIRQASKPNNFPYVMEMLQNPPKGFIGIFSELVYFEDEIESNLAAKLAGPKFFSLIFDNDANYREQFQIAKKAKLGYSIMMTSLDTSSRFTTKASQNQQIIGELPLQLEPGCPTRGFRGFLVNRLQLL